MQRIATFFMLAAAAACLSGCAMCDSSLDYIYPAHGGCVQADECCRAGSAFCGSRISYTSQTVHGGSVVVEPESGTGVPTPVGEDDLPEPPEQTDQGGADLSPEQSSTDEFDLPDAPTTTLRPEQDLAPPPPADDDVNDLFVPTFDSP